MAMTCRGKVAGGVVVLEKPDLLPEGTVVRVEPVTEPNEAEKKALLSLSGKLLRLAGTAKGLPPDMARNHDHYIHGTPKK
ncbi:MAG: hypothetical protein NTW87_35170 [Planctomycetota bacterium]|nr:hypothetical protein [Planctomycetota bacterium]